MPPAFKVSSARFQSTGAGRADAAVAVAADAAVAAVAASVGEEEDEEDGEDGEDEEKDDEDDDEDDKGGKGVVLGSSGGGLLAKNFGKCMWTFLRMVRAPISCLSLATHTGTMLCASTCTKGTP
jgi:hypothetical protein